MDAVDRLRRDHQTLRNKLEVMESALALGPDAWFVLREMSFTLSKQLRDHMEREEELVAVCRHALPPHVLADFAVEHHDEPAHLKTINELFVSKTGRDLGRIRPALLAVIDGLRHHLDDEERNLFPRLDAAIALLVPGIAKGIGRGAQLDDAMTVNRLIREFPSTRRLFDRLFINLEAEGCHGLDEVAWTHGMESGELLAHVRQAIEADEAPCMTAQEARNACDGRAAQ